MTTDINLRERTQELPRRAYRQDWEVARLGVSNGLASRRRNLAHAGRCLHSGTGSTKATKCGGSRRGSRAEIPVRCFAQIDDLTNGHLQAQQTRGRLAQLERATGLHPVGRRFDPCIAQPARSLMERHLATNQDQCRFESCRADYIPISRVRPSASRLI